MNYQDLLMGLNEFFGPSQHRGPVVGQRYRHHVSQHMAVGETDPTTGEIWLRYTDIDGRTPYHPFWWAEID